MGRLDKEHYIDNPLRRIEALERRVETVERTALTDVTAVGGVTDHGSLNGLGDDDHSIYTLVDGTRDFTGVVVGVTPTAASHLATKGYVDGVPWTDHGELSGLGDDDHSQYVHISNARTITAQHEFAPGSSQAPFTLGANAQSQLVTGLRADEVNKQVIAGDGLTGGGTLTANRTLDVGAGTLISVSADAVNIADGGSFQYIGTGSGSTPVWRNVSALAGAGLGENLGLLYIGAGDGIDVGSDDIAVDVTALLGSGLTESSNNIDLDWGTPTIGTIEPDDSAGAGTSTNPARSDHQHAIACAAPWDIEPDDSAAEGTSTSFARADHQHAITCDTPSANSVSVAASGEGSASSFARSDHSHNLDESITPTWTGNHTFEGATRLNFRDSDLRIHSTSDGVLFLGADNALWLSGANTIQLFSSNVDIRGEDLVEIQVGAVGTGDVDINANVNFQGAKTIKSSADSLTLAPADGLVLDPSSGDVTTTAAIGADNFVSQTTGWQVSYAGAADFRDMYADELTVLAFTASVYSALAGGLIITQSRAEVTRDFTIPDTGNTATLYVSDHEGSPDTAVFVANDYVRLRVIDRSGGGLVVADVYGTVTGYSDETGGEQSWTFTTTTTGYSSADVIYAGSVALDYGQTGSGSRGVWEVTVLDAAGSPYSQAQTWSSISSGEPDGFTTHVRTGNLDGLSGVGLEYGLYAGSGLTDTDQYILVTDSQAELHNTDLEVHDGSNTVIRLDYSTPYISVGATAPTGYLTGDGFWVGNDSGTYKLHIGDVDGERLQWNGSDLAIYDQDGTAVFQVDSDGAWLSNLALSPTLADQFFSANDGLLLLGPGCQIAPGKWVSARGQVATLEGAFNLRAGPWAGTRALMVEEETTNLCTNPSMEASAWSQVIGTVSQSSTQVHSGGYSSKCNGPGSGGLGWLARTSNVSVTNGETYTFSAWLFIESYESGTIYFRMRDSSWGNISISGALADTDLIGQWQRVTGTFSATETSSAWRCEFLSSNSATTAVVYIDDVQIEESDYATSYCDGSLGAGYAWTGTPHASTSTRTANYATLDDHAGMLDDLNTVTYSVWIQAQYDADDANWPCGANPAYIVDVYGDASNRLIVRFNPSTSDRFALWLNGSATITVNNQTFKAGDWLHLVVTADYSNDSYKMYLNGDLIGSSSASFSAPAGLNLWKLGVPSGTNVGYSGGWTYGEYAVFSRVLSAEEVAALYHRNAPLSDAGAFDTPGLYILDGRFSLATSTSGARTQIDGSGWWAYDADGDAAFGLALEDSTSWGGKTLDKADLLLGREAASTAWLLWDASVGDVTLGVNATTLIQIDASEPSVLIGDQSNEHVEITSTAINLNDGGTTYTSLSGGALTLGDTSNEHVTVDTSGVTLSDGATDYAVFATTTTLGDTTTGEYISLSSSGIEMYSNSIKVVDIANDGDFTFGEVAASKANIFFDRSEGRLNFRGNTTVQAYVDTDGSIVAGGGNVTINSDGITADISTTANQFVTLDASGEVGYISAVHIPSGGLQASVLDIVIDLTDDDIGQILMALTGSTARMAGGINQNGLFVGTISSDITPLSFTETAGFNVGGHIWITERSSDPDEPAEGESVIWMSDGTGKGNDGDVLIASKAGGTTKYVTLFDHDAEGLAW